jgi:hypothetical protein
MRGRDDLAGLVQSYVDQMLGRTKQLSVDLDVVVVNIGLAAEFGDRLSVYRNPALDNQLLCFTTAGYSGARENLLQPLFHLFLRRGLCLLRLFGLASSR